MTDRVRHSTLLATVLLLVCAPISHAAAQEDSAQACVEAYEAAQELKLDGKLVQASERARACAQPQCPEIVRSDCTKWAVQLREATPTIVVVAKGAGGDLSDVRVYVDDALVVETLTGEPLAIDPGQHKLRFEHGDAEPVERELLIAVGVRNRTVTVRFATAPEAPSPAAQEDADGDDLPIAGMALVGLGVASGVVFAALAAIGTNQVDDLRASCGQTHSCAESDVNDAKLKIIVGDVFLGVGVLSAGIGAALILAHYVGGGDAQSAVRWGIAPSPNGGAGVVEFRF
jgi:hypothetical protein